MTPEKLKELKSFIDEQLHKYLEKDDEDFYEGCETVGKIRALRAVKRKIEELENG